MTTRVVTSVFIPQTKYAEQWQPGVRLARPAVGCVRSLGEKCWSQLMVRAVERGNTDTGEGSVTLSESEWPLQNAASGEQ